MNWEAIAGIVDKIGFLAVVIFLVYVFLKTAVGWLVDQAFESDAHTEEPIAVPVPDVPGLHVLSEDDDQTRCVDKNPTEDTIRAMLRSLDWDGGFHAVFLVTAPGVSLEVGGSLAIDIGLSSVFRDLHNEIYRVVSQAPATIENLEDLLVSFYKGDGRWEQMYDYE